MAQFTDFFDIYSGLHPFMEALLPFMAVLRRFMAVLRPCVEAAVPVFGCDALAESSAVLVHTVLIKHSVVLICGSGEPGRGSAGVHDIRWYARIALDLGAYPSSELLSSPGPHEPVAAYPRFGLAHSTRPYEPVAAYPSLVRSHSTRPHERTAAHASSVCAMSSHVFVGC